MQRRRSGRLVTAVLCAGLVLGHALPTSATESDPTTSPTTAEILDQVRADLAESSQAMVDAASNLRLAEAALPAAQRNVATTHRLLLAAQHRQEAAARRRGVAQTRLIQANQDAEQVTEAVNAQHARIGRLARAVYQGGGSWGNLSMLLEARSPTDFAERLVALQTVVSSQRVALDGLRDIEDSSRTRTAALAVVRDQMAVADRQARDELAVISALEQQARAAEAEVSRLMKVREDALAAVRTAQVEDDQRHQVLQSESSSLQRDLAAQATRALGAAGSRAGSTVPPRPGTLAWPANGPITSPFGMRVHPITGVRKLHTGTDLGVPCGTPLHVARDGVVIAAGFNTAYGFRTVVSHGVVDGALLTTTYNHQSHIGVVVGQQVTQGEEIGLSGTTGYSTGCHLHFELLVNADYVDPVPWLAPR
ncbi:MAG: peptidoglycan DD-metalloendopeptidase family protein [Actinomycetes bacterium]